MGSSLHVAAGSLTSGDVREQRRILGAAVVAPLLIVLAPDFLVVAAIVALVGSALFIRHADAVTVRQSASNDLAVAGAVFFLAAVWSVIANPGGFQGFGALVRFAIVPIGFATVRNAVRRDLRPAIWLGAVVGATAAGVSSVLMLVLAHMPRPTSYVNPIHFGEMALVLGFVAAVTRGLATGTSRRVDRWTLFAVACALTAAVLSHARGGWLALPVIVLVAMVQNLRAPNRRVLRYVAALVLVSMPVMTVAALANDREALRAFDKGIGQTIEYATTRGGEDVASTSVGSRFEMWRSAVAGFRAAPVLGVGWGNMDERFAEDVNAGVRAERIAEHGHPHNQYISHLGSGGLVGFVSLLALLMVPGWICLRVFFRTRETEQQSSLQPLAGAGLIIVLGYAVFALTDSVFETASPLIFYVLAVGTILAQIDRLGGEQTFVYPATHGMEQPQRSVARHRTDTL